MASLVVSARLFLAHVNARPMVWTVLPRFLADDVKIYRSISGAFLDSRQLHVTEIALPNGLTVDCVGYYQRKILAVAHWFEAWMPLWNSKVLIPIASSVQELGVPIDESLQRTTRCELGQLRCRWRIAFAAIQCSCIEHCKAFSASSHPILIHGCLVWSPFFKSQMEMLENVQISFTKTAL